MPTNSWEYDNYNRPHLGEKASGEDLLNLLHGVSHFLVSFNPGADWWTSDTNVTPFPLAAFDNLAQIKTSGGILPLQSHALSLALVNIAIASIVKEHVVLLDSEGNETTDQDNTMGVRYSDKARTPLSGGTIVTTARNASLALETVLKFSASFERLATWKVGANRHLDDDLSKEPDPKKRDALIKEYSTFVKGMYGSDSNFDRLTSHEEGSMRKKLEKVELALALLGASFAKPEPNGSFSCYNQLVKNLDLRNSEEQKLGKCSEEDEKRWKRVMAQVASLYHSPLFAKFALAPSDQ